MPVEGNLERLQTPIRSGGSRDRRVLIAIAIAALAGVAAVAYALATQHAEPLPAGCVEFTIADVVGGSTVRHCGDTAVKICRQAQGKTDPASKAAQEACARAGIPAAGT